MFGMEIRTLEAALKDFWKPEKVLSSISRSSKFQQTQIRRARLAGLALLLSLQRVGIAHRPSTLRAPPAPASASVLPDTASSSSWTR